MIRIKSVTIDPKAWPIYQPDHWQHVLENDNPSGWTVAAFKCVGRTRDAKLRYERMGDIVWSDRE